MFVDQSDHVSCECRYCMDGPVDSAPITGQLTVDCHHLWFIEDHTNLGGARRLFADPGSAKVWVFLIVTVCRFPPFWNFARQLLSIFSHFFRLQDSHSHILTRYEYFACANLL